MASFSAGDTFLAPSPRTEKLHLTIVLCDPSGDPPTILTVSFNTRTHLTDPTIILNVGDHPFIAHETVVSYDEMLCVRTDLLEQLEAMNQSRLSTDRTFRRHQPVSPHLLDRIIQGAFVSELAPKGLIRQLKERLGIKD
jgi:hypothetical protein